MTVGGIYLVPERPWRQILEWNCGNRCGNQGLQYTKFIGDDDSSTIKRIRDSVDFDVEKWSDPTHAKRALRKPPLHTEREGKQGTV